MANEREIAETRLALLVHDASVAETPQEKQQAQNALRAFSQNTRFIDLGMIADEARAIANAATRQDAIDKMREKLGEISALDNAFKSARKVAQDGEEHLLFPRLASALGQVETVLETLKDQFDAIAANVNTMKNGVDLQKL